MQNRPLLLSVYYYLNRAFQTEQEQVFTGRIAYHRQLQDDEGNRLYLLRRNVHRLEKGITARQRRQVFGQGYIAETVDAFDKVVARGQGESSVSNQWTAAATVTWAADALSEYFDTVGETPAVEAARAVFEDTLSRSGISAGDAGPCRCAERPGETVSYQAMLGLAMHRRSIRWYQQRPVPHDLLDQALEVARQSPSACNRQPFRFLICDDPEVVPELARLPGGATGFAENIPCLIAVVGQQRSYFSDRDLHLIYIDGSLAAMTFMYALETLGLSSCCINWPNDMETERAGADLLGLAPDERIIMLLSVGFPDPDALVAASAKRSLDDLRTYTN